MSIQRPIVTAQHNQRRLACVPTALLAFIVNDDERILMLSHPNSGDRWEVINGALEHDETLLEGLRREIREETGGRTQVRPLSALHTFSFPYAEGLPYMTCVCYLFAYEGGDIVPGDDMTGSRVRWIDVEEIASGDVTVIVPRFVPWVFARAVDLYRLLKDHPPVVHQPPFEAVPPPKYDK